MGEKRLVKKALLRKLIPFSALSEIYLDEIASNMYVEFLPAGQILFKQGHSDGCRIYLLSGQLVLEGPEAKTKDIKSGSDAARYPLDHHQPHWVSAIAKTNVLFTQVEDELMERFLTCDQSGGYNVDEFNEQEKKHNNDDWMTRMLRIKSFNRVPAVNLQAMFMRMDSVSYQAGEVIVQQGETGDYYYIVNRGKCEITRASRNADSQIKLTVLGPGDSFGEEALVSKASRNANVIAVTDVVLMRLKRSDFETLLKEPVLKTVSYREAQAMEKKGAIWLDVRIESEYKNERINGSINIPLYILRVKIAGLDANKTYIVYCETGHRSSVAAYLLNERSFDVYMLQGGLQGLKAHIPVLTEEPAG